MEPVYTISSPGAFGSGELKKKIFFFGGGGGRVDGGLGGETDLGEGGGWGG